MAIGCHAEVTPPDDEAVAAVRVAQDPAFDPEPTPAGPTLDELFLQIAKEIPGFAGIVLGENGVVEIKLVDTTNGLRARAVVAQVFAGARSVQGRTTRLVKARYSFAQLDSWRALLHEKGLPRGVRLIDADERRNALVIGTRDEPGAQSARQFARSLGIPDDAVMTELLTEIRPLADSLGKYLRPVVGGLLIATWNSPGVANACSLGFKAKKVSSTRYVITNSHCTATKEIGTLAGDSVGQPNFNYWIGNEVQDPGFTSTNCNSGYTCRWSDAALFQCNPGSTCANYTIARTTFEYTGSDWVNGSGSLELASEPWYVVGELPNGSLVQGASISKVGAGSGWTGATINRACTDIIDYPTPGKILKCQFTSLAVSRNTDSGSSVFQYEASTGKAWLGGIVWGVLNIGYLETAFSSLDGIKTDLGSMTVYSSVF
ncbi:MAG: hypothetical protein ACT4PM_06765 [Gemmatimonadales bacterium]